MTKLMDTMTWPEISEKIMRECKDNSKKFKTWLLSKESLKGYYFDSLTWHYCYKVQDKINNKDEDHVEGIIGIEGSGKSTLSIQKCCVIDPSFCQERIFNKPIKLFKWLDKHTIEEKDGTVRLDMKGKAIQLDEGILFFFSREGMSIKGVSMVALFNLMRQANMFVSVCMPHYNLLDTYVRNHRLMSLTRITRKKKTFCYYNQSAIKIINKAIRKGVEWGSIRVPDGMFYEGYWNKDFPQLNDLASEQYISDKAKNWKSFLQGAISKLDIGEQSAFMKISEACRMFGISRSAVEKNIHENKIPHIKIGGSYLLEKEFFLEKMRNMGNAR